MNSNPQKMNVNPPRLIGSLMAGFHSVANHPWVILFPVGLDLLLLFTPRLRVEQLLLPALIKGIEQTGQMSGSNAETMSLAGDFLRNLLANFDLNSALRSYPLGIPSLVAGMGGAETPLGEMSVVQFNSLGNAFLVYVGLALLGLVFGAIFLAQVSNLTRDPESLSPQKPLYWKIGQSLITTVALFLLTGLILIPGSLIISLLSMINPLIGQMAIFLFLFLVFWFVVPWFYAYHGIFIFDLSAIRSVLLSLKVGRIFIAKTATLILLIFLLSQGLDRLWLTPPAASWLILFGIFGHAFVSAALFSTSVIYYRQINQFLLTLVSLRQKDLNTA